MSDMYENLLPLGSVVLLKGANKRVMVFARIQTIVGKGDIFDYAACSYPEGLADPQNVIFFNHDDIARVYFIGFQDSDELLFREKVLANLGELYVDENGRIAEREKSEKEEVASWTE